jgi:hypothetical protein
MAKNNLGKKLNCALTKEKNLGYAGIDIAERLL